MEMEKSGIAEAGARKTGAFIVLDGNDGSGKATQTRLLLEKLGSTGVPVQAIDFPQYQNNVFGQLLSECLAGARGDFLNLDPKIASALYALDRHESAEQIRGWLEEGKVVVADRFASSNQIHQGGKIEDEHERRTFLEWLDHMEHSVLKVPRPDAILYLRVPLEMSLELLQKKRAAKNHALAAGERDVVEQDRAYLTRSIASAEALASSSHNWHLIDCVQDDALRSPESIHEEIHALVTKLLS